MKNLILLIFLIGFSGMAQEIDEEYLESHPNWEKWHDEIPVSGGTRVGLMAIEKAVEYIVPKNFYVNLPASKDIKKICVEISSRDGRYSAKAQYYLKSDNSWQEFSFPTKFYSELKKYKIGEVVLLASIGEGCESPVKSYLVSSWNKIENPEKIAFYINSSLPSGIISPGEDEKVICKETPAPSVAYNKECILNASEFSGDLMFQLMQREETMGEISINKYDFPINYTQ